eukprot:gene6185-1105_t
MADKGFGIKSKVFFRAKGQGYVQGVVVDVRNKRFSCKASPGPQNPGLKSDVKADDVPADELFSANPDDLRLCLGCPADAAAPGATVDPGKSADLVTLPEANAAAVLQAIRLRYHEGMQYTLAGPDVVASVSSGGQRRGSVADAVTNARIMNCFLGPGRTPASDANAPAHPWRLAHDAYWSLRDEGAPQCIAASGLAGSGKTEACKQVVRLLLEMNHARAPSDKQDAKRYLAEMVAASDRVLEAFGNCSTSASPNASRYLQAVQLRYNGAGNLTGKFGVGPPTRFTSTNGGGQLARYDGSDDGADYREVRAAMTTLGMADEEQDAVYAVLGATLALINIEITDDGYGNANLNQLQETALRSVAAALKVDFKGLRDELLTNTKTKAKHLKGHAIRLRNTACVYLYATVFSHLTSACNQACGPTLAGGAPGELGDAPPLRIDVLDWPGHTSTTSPGGFGTLLVNTGAEVVSSMFRPMVLQRDVDDVAAEGLEAPKVDVPDHGACIDLLCGEGGVLQLLDMASKRDSDQPDHGFMSDASGASVGGWAAELFSVQRGDEGSTSGDLFKIHHTAQEPVVYNPCRAVAESGTPDTSTGLLAFLSGSRSDFISGLMRHSPGGGEAVSHSGPERPLDGFQASLRLLKASLNLEHTTRWVVCVRAQHGPSVTGTAMDIGLHGDYVLDQLKSFGVVATAQLKRSGFPIRIAFLVFLARFRACLPELGKNLTDKDMPKAFSAILSKAGVSDNAGRVGATKVMLSPEGAESLSKHRAGALEKWVLPVQRVGRGCLGRGAAYAAHYELNRACLEKEARELAAKRAEQERLRAAAERAAQQEREERDRKMFKERSAAAATIQSLVRGQQQRVRYRRDLLEQKRADLEMHDDMTVVAFHQIWTDLDAKRCKAEARDDACRAAHSRRVASLDQTEEHSRVQLERRLLREMRQSIARMQPQLVDVVAMQKWRDSCSGKSNRPVSTHKCPVEATQTPASTGLAAQRPSGATPIPFIFSRHQKGRQTYLSKQEDTLRRALEHRLTLEHKRALHAMSLMMIEDAAVVQGKARYNGSPKNSPSQVSRPFAPGQLPKKAKCFLPNASRNLAVMQKRTFAQQALQEHMISLEQQYAEDAHGRIKRHADHLLNPASSPPAYNIPSPPPKSSSPSRGPPPIGSSALDHTKNTLPYPPPGCSIPMNSSIVRDMCFGVSTTVSSAQAAQKAYLNHTASSPQLTEFEAGRRRYKDRIAYESHREHLLECRYREDKKIGVTKSWEAGCGYPGSQQGSPPSVGTLEETETWQHSFKTGSTVGCDAGYESMVKSLSPQQQRLETDWLERVDHLIGSRQEKGKVPAHSSSSNWQAMLHLLHESDLTAVDTHLE